MHRSANMGWYEGSSLLHHLEDVHIASDRNLLDVRFPVQFVIRPQSGLRPDYRGYAGTVAGGVLKPGDDVVALPSGFATTIAAIDGPGGDPVSEAFPPMAVTIRLADELDVSRGDLLCRPGNRPHVGQDVDATVCWLAELPGLRAGGRYVLKHTTRAVKALVRSLDYRLDINTLHRDEEAVSLELNEIGRIRLRTQSPLLFDEYRRNRTTGSFILIDEPTGATVAAGMIIGPATERG